MAVGYFSVDALDVLTAMLPYVIDDISRWFDAKLLQVPLELSGFLRIANGEGDVLPAFVGAISFKRNLTFDD